ncbi:MAG: prepilin peptidase, partial [Coxiellaceae bacterium]|nr:prepilin peptidase [Coxiellaceae bacterium]
MTLILTAVVGLIIGSFLNVVIVRYPKMLEQQWKEEAADYLKQPLPHKTHKINLIGPRSHCPKCRKKLKAWHNIPVISYLLLRGKCAFCKKTISPIYPIVEMLAAAVAIIVICRFGL